MNNIEDELRIRAYGGHEGHRELEIMCGKAADEIERLQAALKLCAAPIHCGNQDGIDDEAIAREANRRQTIAAKALGLPTLSSVYEPPEVDLNKCPKCGGPADNGHDRCLPPSPYYCTKCMDEEMSINQDSAGE